MSYISWIFVLLIGGMNVSYADQYYLVQTATTPANKPAAQTVTTPPALQPQLRQQVVQPLQQPPAPTHIVSPPMINPVFPQRAAHVRSVKDKETLYQAQFIGGGWVGTLFGFGVGHVIQKRYWPFGFLFTMVEAGTVSFSLYMCIGKVNRYLNENVRRFKSFIPCILSGLPYIAFRVWEMIDVWSVPSSYKLISKKVSLTPVYSYNEYSESNHYGLALQYQW